jgi:hypothetical protein
MAIYEPFLVVILLRRCPHRDGGSADALRSKRRSDHGGHHTTTLMDCDYTISHRTE